MKGFQSQTLYEVLEVSVGATAPEIKAAHERLARLYAEEQVVLYGLVDPLRASQLREKLSEAARVLCDDDARDRYDQSIGLPPRELPAKKAPVPPPRPVAPAPAAVTTGWGGTFAYVSASAPAPLVSAPFSYSAPLVSAPLAHVAPLASAPSHARPAAVAPPEPVAPVEVPAPRFSPAHAVVVAAPPPALVAPTVVAAAQPVVAAPLPVVVASTMVAPVQPVAVALPPLAVAPGVDAPAQVAAPMAAQPVVVAAPTPGVVEPAVAAAVDGSLSGVAEQSPNSAAPIPLVQVAPTAPVEAPPEDDVPRLDDEDVQVSIVPVRTTSREYRVPEPKMKPYEVPPGVEFNGDLLKQVRLARAISLMQLSERTRISVKHLEAVEADRYDALPVGVYLRGILMSVARELGLDGVGRVKELLGLRRRSALERLTLGAVRYEIRLP